MTERAVTFQNVQVIGFLYELYSNKSLIGFNPSGIPSQFWRALVRHQIQTCERSAHHRHSRRSQIMVCQAAEGQIAGLGV